MEIISEPETNPDTGQKEVMIKLVYEEIDYIKDCIVVVVQHGLMDADDPQKIKLSKSLKSGFLNAKGLLRP